MTFNGLDWLIVAIIVLSTLISLKRGFIKESLSLVIWVLAVVVALVLYPQMADYLHVYIDSASIRKVVAIVTLFVATLLVGSVILFIIGRLVVITGLTGLDRLLGLVFGLLRGVLVVVFLMLLAQYLLPVSQEVWWQQSSLVPYFSQLETWLLSFTHDLRVMLQPLFEHVLEHQAAASLTSFLFVHCSRG